MPRSLRLLGIILSSSLLTAGSCSPTGTERSPVLPAEISFNQHIRPLLSDRCFACHGPDQQKCEADLRLDVEAHAKDSLTEAGIPAWLSGNPSQSEAWRRIISDDPDELMPPPNSHLSLSEDEKALLQAWIEQGAEYEPFWAFVPPASAVPPAVDTSWGQNVIDAFVWERQRAQGLHPQPEAEPEVLFRRLWLDVTGLPPSVEEIDEFLEAEEAEGVSAAYESWVDRLLASPAAAERLANEWMDVARYADTHGYTVDRYRPAWRWRDWVIEAFQQNMPYDQFVAWQLAGDLMPHASQAQRLATGFNRNHAQNMEGGIVNEEFRVEYVADRTHTFGTAFLGLTLECARCHDHKYDPISQKNYYQLFSFFNNVDEAGQISWDNALPVPTMVLSDEETEEQIRFLKQQVRRQADELAAYRQAAVPEEVLRPSLELGPRALPGLVAHVDMEGVRPAFVPNRARPGEAGKVIDPVNRQVVAQAPPEVEGKVGRGLRLNGDDALSFPRTGVFGRADPFSMGLWVKLPEALDAGVIFHKNEGGIIYNFRGYQLSLEEGRLDVRLAHTFPYNAIHLKTTEAEAVPREEWVHLMLTYDGSSKAKGVRVYVNGKPLELEVLRDRLYKDLLFGREQEPGLKVGARWRSKGLTGAEVDELVVYARALSEAEVTFLAGTKQPGELPDNAWKDYGLARKDEAYGQKQDSLNRLRRTLAEREEALEEVMVMDELPRPRPSFVLKRGVYNAHGEAVYPATPAAVWAFDSTLSADRLGLAGWLTAPEHPLFARVTVNRYWQMLFGRGLVRTSEDFGSQGALPSHPALLDVLAVQFVESGYDLRALLKRMLLSATYRQRSAADAEVVARDPENKWLSRGPSQRLTAEMLRDQALKASGLLVEKLGGASVKPYQPEGLWRVNGGRYVADTGANRYRRSLYTFWKRTVPPPSMNVFDAPSRSYCLVRRQKTNTPLQALTLMNDPQFTEATAALTQRLGQLPKGVDARLTYAFRALTGRTPRAEELGLLRELYNRQLDKHPPTASAAGRENDAEAFAYEMVIATILNLDASLYKR